MQILGKLRASVAWIIALNGFVLKHSAGVASSEEDSFYFADLIFSERFSVESDFFVEIFNPTNYVIDTSGYRICYKANAAESSDDAGCASDSFVLPSVELMPEDFLVVCWTSLLDRCQTTLNPETFGLTSVSDWRTRPLRLWRLAQDGQVIVLDQITPSSDAMELLTAEYSWHRFSANRAEWNADLATPGKKRNSYSDLASWGPVPNRIILSKRLGPGGGSSYEGSQDNAEYYLELFNAGVSEVNVTGYKVCSEDLDNRCLTLQVPVSANSSARTGTVFSGSYFPICFEELESKCQGIFPLLGESPESWRRLLHIALYDEKGVFVEENYCPACVERTFFNQKSFYRLWSHPGSEWVAYFDAVVGQGELRHLPPDYDATAEVTVPQHPIFSEYSLGGGSQGPWVEIFNPTDKVLNLNKYFVCRTTDSGDCFFYQTGDEVNGLEPGKYFVYCWNVDAGSCPGKFVSFYTPWLDPFRFDNNMQLWFGDAASNGAGRWYVDNSLPPFVPGDGNAGKSWTRVSIDDDGDAWTWTDNTTPGSGNLPGSNELSSSQPTPSPTVSPKTSTDPWPVPPYPKASPSNPSNGDDGHSDHNSGAQNSTKGSPNEDDDSSNSNSTVLAIALVAVGLVALILLGAVVYLYRRQEKPSNGEPNQGQDEAPEQRPPPFSPEHTPLPPAVAPQMQASAPMENIEDENENDDETPSDPDDDKTQSADDDGRETPPQRETAAQEEVGSDEAEGSIEISLSAGREGEHETIDLASDNAENDSNV